MVAGGGIALSSLPMVCKSEEHKAGLVVELFVVFSGDNRFSSAAND